MRVAAIAKILRDYGKGYTDTNFGLIDLIREIEGRGKISTLPYWYEEVPLKKLSLDEVKMVLLQLNHEELLMVLDAQACQKYS